MRLLDTDTVVAAVLLAVFAAMAVVAAGYPPEARFVPLVVAVPATLLAAWQLSREVAKRRSARDVPRTPTKGNGDASHAGIAIGWLFLFTLIVLSGGFVVGGTLAVMTSQRLWLRESWRTTVGGGVLAFVGLQFCFERLLGLTLFSGWVAEWIR